MNIHGKAAILSATLVAILLVLTGIVWQEQLAHQKTLLYQHTEDVCLQASRRLEIFVESRLKMASVFALRWSTHENRDFSQRRFRDFSAVVIKTLPGYHSIQLVSPDMNEVWVTPENARPLIPPPDNALDSQPAETRVTQKITLSQPFQSGDGETNVFAALALQREEEFLGYLLVEFRIKSLIDDCFHQKIRSEFDFFIRDENTVLYSYNFKDDDESARADKLMVAKTFPVANRIWQLSMKPRKEYQVMVGYSSNLSVPVLGILLSFGVGILFYLQSQKMHMFRSARDRLLEEIRKREETQEELHGSETRYRNVFDSTNDGFLVLEKDGRIIDGNNATLTMYQFNREELTGRSFKQMLPADQQELYEDFMQELVKEKKAHMETVNIKKDGYQIHVELRGSLVKYGKKERVLLTITDVSERKRIEQQRALLSRKILIAQEDERSRISRELHDDLGQLLTALHIELDCLRKTTDQPTGESMHIITNATDLVEKSAEELRRICRGLRPPLLDDLGLEPALRLLVTEFRELTGIETNLDIQALEDRLIIDNDTALSIYRILQESLTNITRHARADRVNISLIHRLTDLVLTIYDNGKGFDMDSEPDIRASGIAGMRERADLLDGSFEIWSSPSQGTRVVFRVPVQRDFE